jgi:hypothetical protein
MQKCFHNKPLEKEICMHGSFTDSREKFQQKNRTKRSYDKSEETKQKRREKQKNRYSEQ